jgi:hypothetical protein
MVNRAKELAEDLMVVVRQEWQKTKAMNDSYMYQQGGAYGGDNPYAAYQVSRRPSGQLVELTRSGAAPSVCFGKISLWKLNALCRPSDEAPPLPPGAEQPPP